MEMPIDGSHQDHNREHASPAVDCLEELAIYWYEEDIAPEVVNHKKLLSDMDDIVREIMKPTQAGAPPIISFGRFRIPDLTKHMGIVLNTDRSYGDFKKAVALNLTGLQRDPADPMRLLLPDGRDIFAMDKSDWLALLRQEQRQRPSNGIFEIFAMNKSPMIQTAETGLKAGANHGLSMKEIQKRRDLIFSVPSIRDNIMDAFSDYLISIQKNPEDQFPDPRPEEYRFNAMGDPKRPNIKRADGDMQAKRAIESAMYERARSKRDYYSKRNRYVKLMIRPNPRIEGIDPDPAAYKEFQTDVNKALRAYHRMVQASHLKTKQRIEKLRLPKKVKFEDNADALDFIWRMRENALKGQWLVDLIADHYWIEDINTGREIPQSHISDVDVREFNDNFDVNRGKWDIQFERTNYSQHFLAGMFVMAGKKRVLTKLDPAWQDWYDAKVAFGNNGSPYLDPSSQRLPTNETELDVLERIRRNALDVNDAMKGLSSDPDDALGLYEKFVAGAPGKERHAMELEALYKERQKKFKWTPKTMALAGYDPSTGQPRENILYPVAADEFEQAQKFDLPEKAPDYPITDPRFGEMLYPLPSTPSLEKAWKRGDLAGTANVIFKSKSSGRQYMAPMAEFKRVVLGTDPSLRFVWQQALRVFDESGIHDYPEDKPVFLVSAESMTPLAGTKPIEAATELQVIGEHRFTALYDPILAGYHKDTGNGKRAPLTGLAMPEYDYDEESGYDLKKGSKIRLREIEDKTGAESGWEVSTTLTSAPKYLTLQEFEESFHAGKVNNRMAQNYGFTDARHMYREVSNWFTSIQRPKDSPENRILLVRFKPVDKENMVYFDPTIIPRAAVTDNYYQTKGEMRNKWGSFPANKL